MSQLFVWVVTAHFLALLTPGPDFFLIVRTALRAGWPVAVWACVGIACANGLYIALALGGVALMGADSQLLRVLQGVGGLYLLSLGWAAWREAASGSLAPPTSVTSTTEPAGRGSLSRPGAWLAGFFSALLNPKNPLFYASLAALLGADVTAGWRWLLGLWMVTAVLVWDALVAAAAGHPRVRSRFARWLPALTRGCGAVLMASGGTLVGAAAFRR